MTVEEIILAWKNQDYAMSLSDEERNANVSPVGEAGAVLAAQNDVLQDDLAGTCRTCDHICTCTTF